MPVAERESGLSCVWPLCLVGHKDPLFLPRRGGTVSILGLGGFDFGTQPNSWGLVNTPFSSSSAYWGPVNTSALSSPSAYLHFSTLK
ncbi:rCG57655 [Rattus norvegicus]|uniref:RCG57655 n=1 Tax=Rattus norvegicus TaxID=10116 RepID=A6JI12_RAT|nr:rCG57655 [Rattus norvegicus]